MKLSKVRTGIAVAVFTLLAAGLIVGVGSGTLSGFGLDEIYALCPLGAIEVMIAEHTIIPRAVVTIIGMALVVFLLGRVFCAFICPVSFLTKIRDFFSSPKARKKRKHALIENARAISQFELENKKSDVGCKGCTSRAQKHKQLKLDSRHAILGGALLSTAIFGFPVFCLICPVGLSFATVLLIWRAFAFGDSTIGIIIVPVMLALEIIFLRKWCGRFCPLSALMNLVSRFSRTWVPTIDDSACIETASGRPCGICAAVCEADINPRHPEQGEHTLADCTRCHVCVDSCPVDAIHVPFLARKRTGAKTPELLVEAETTETREK